MKYSMLFLGSFIGDKDTSSGFSTRAITQSKNHVNDGKICKLIIIKGLFILQLLPTVYKPYLTGRDPLLIKDSYLQILNSVV
jgi:hypothetical protein